jgi:tetratricopeptide (TPR) repeat protein
VLTRFRTLESLLLLVAGLALTAAACRLAGLGAGWTAAFCATFALFGFPMLAIRVQDRLLELYVSTGRFRRALTLASAIRGSAMHPVARALAEFDLALIHLARGAPADARRTLGRIERHRLQPRTRLLVELHDALAALRTAAPEGAAGTAQALETAADSALQSFPDDPHLLAMKGEARLALGDGAGARLLLRRSLELDGDPGDPSPGERHLLFARAAAAAGALDEARRGLQVAAALRSGPFVEAARAELARLAPDA